MGEINYGSLDEFIHESNAIEGIHRPPSPEELSAHTAFLALPALTIASLQALVDAIAPGHVLRSEEGNDVRVGRYFPPKGGPEIVTQLDALLKLCNDRAITAHQTHIRYEKLHPFSDGNGRSGRALWLWMRYGHAPLKFLHHFYYETLANAL